MPAERITSFSPWHLVVVLDDSWSMEGRKIEIVNEAMRALVDELKLWSGGGNKPYFLISVIKFGSSSSILSEAVGEGSVDIVAVSTLRGDSGTTNAAQALGQAVDVLKRNPGKEHHFVPFVFFLSDGKPDDEKEALSQGSRLKSLSLASGQPRLITIGIGDADDHFMKDLASSRHGEPRYRRLHDPEEIRRFLPTIGTVAASVAASRVGAAEQLEEAIITI